MRVMEMVRCREVGSYVEPVGEVVDVPITELGIERSTSRVVIDGRFVGDAYLKHHAATGKKYMSEALFISFAAPKQPSQK